MTRTIFTLVTFAAALLACGSDPPVIPPDVPKLLLPVAVGHRWTYRVTDPSGVVTSKVQTVTGTAAVDGAIAYRLETRRANDKVTRSVQQVVDGRLLRVLEDEYDTNLYERRYVYSPHALRVDSTKITKDTTYVDTHEKIELDPSGTEVARVAKTHTFLVEAENELVTVPAGTFECVRVRRIRQDGSTKTYWYAPGLGKVKETGEQIEELERAELN